MAKIFPAIAAPETAKIAQKSVHHGIEKTDEYAWLRADNWQEVFQDPSKLDPAILAQLQQENAYQAEMMTGTEELQAKLFAEMKGRIKEDDSSVPEKDGEFAYGSAFAIGGEQPYFFRTKRDGGEQSIYLDGHKEGVDKAYFQLGGVSYAPDHKKFLWSYDDKGSEFYNIKIRDFGRDSDHDEILSHTSGDGVWDANAQGFFYSKLDENHRASEIFYHRLGTQQSEDRLIFKEEDSRFFVQVSGSALEDYIFINLHDHETSEIWYLPANDPSAQPKLIKARETGVEYEIIPAGEQFYILTNMDKARDFKVMVTPSAQPEPENWQDFIPHEEGRLIVGFDAYENYLLWLETQNCLPAIKVWNRATKDVHSIAFDEEAYSLGLHGAVEYDSDIIRFSYSSPTTPRQLFEYDLSSRERNLLKEQEVPSGHNASDYVARRLMAKAHDGELVPLTLLYRKDIALDGSAPCLLYGYGAYGMSMPASFSTTVLSLVDRGFIYCVAHIRGGKEKGYHWYENGKLKNKTNTFHDFITAGRYLVENGFTSHEKLMAFGGSAGGMLMGAIANMAPNDYAAIVAAVPFVDVLNTMLDASLPLTPPEWSEWGNPIESKDDYDLIASYSPYDNVKQQAYPPMLVLAGLTDPRVTYWEPAKWVARLRERKSDYNPVLFRINMDAGHAGASGRFSRLEEWAYMYSFMLKIVNYDILAEKI
ncbi:S9 family peptidase [Bartonella sp. HY329]|uniref:S9 family peptidase n=1 Tax=unclassified Bartonella TaxID=2645622 RepID=UPI0021C68BFB|nr:MULTISPECIES: S9 family peptidase [unclassified Bartonella]UXM94403.1 S9 family peptidase [Bartonella sp. HY329]UXN08726.1 S9 family peptidase [Bartonella sp. HY328]